MLKTGRSMRHETLLLVGDMKDAVVVTSVLFLLVTGWEKLDAICWGQCEDLGFLRESSHTNPFRKYLTSDSHQITFFKQYFTKSVGPEQISAE